MQQQQASSWDCTCTEPGQQAQKGQGSKGQPQLSCGYKTLRSSVTQALYGEKTEMCQDWLASAPLPRHSVPVLGGDLEPGHSLPVCARGSLCSSASTEGSEEQEQQLISSLQVGN